jgi:ATP-dependent RNA helicase DeaD
VAPLPTEAALQAKRLGAMRAAIEERIKAGGLDGPRAFVAELAHNVDILDIAAAAVSLLHSDGDSDKKEDRVEERDDARPEVASGPMIQLWVGAGRLANIRPGDLVGAITSEARLDARQLGKITIAPSYSLVELPEALADRVIRALQKTTLRGQRVEVRRDRGTPLAPRRPRA